MRTLALATVLALALACQAPRPAPAAAPQSAAAHANRDPHGPPEVERYIATLLAPERIERLRVPLVLEKLDPAADASIGDLGCGPGIFSLAFAERCPAGLVFASDVEPAQLDALAARAKSAGAHNVVPVLASMDDPHFPPGRLDLVFIADTYHHLENRVEYMRQLARCLAPGGRLAVLDYKPGPQPHGPPPEHKLAAGVMQRELEQAGYVQVQSFDTHPEQDFQVWRPATPWERKQD